MVHLHSNVIQIECHAQNSFYFHYFAFQTCRQLFTIEGITGVMFGTDFITITKVNIKSSAFAPLSGNVTHWFYSSRGECCHSMGKKGCPTHCQLKNGSCMENSALYVRFPLNLTPLQSNFYFIDKWWLCGLGSYKTKHICNSDGLLCQQSADIYWWTAKIWYRFVTKSLIEVLSMDTLRSRARRSGYEMGY